MADWSELPLDLLQFISNLTNINHSDTRRLRSVCSSWRFSIPPRPSTFFESPTMKFFTSQACHFELRLVKRTIFLLSPSLDPALCWVVKMEEHKPGVFQLLSQFSKGTYIKEVSGKILDLTNVNTLELGYDYVLSNVNNNNSVWSENGFIENNNYHMSSYDMENDEVAFMCVGGNGNFTLISTHNSTGKLLMYRSKTQEWIFLDDFSPDYDPRSEYANDWSLCYVDVVLYDERFYAVTNSGKTVVIDCIDESFVLINLMVNSIVGGDKKFLVKSDEDLLLVDLYSCSVNGSLEVNAIDVYRLDKEGQKWVLLTSLGGRAIFLTNDSSFCVRNLHGLKENCIYFSFENKGKDSYEKRSENINDNEDYYNEDEVESNNEIGIFDYDKGNFESFEENEALKFFCWPPPSWVNLQ